MKIAQDLGIWMDHTHAHLIEFTAEPIETTTLDSKFTRLAKEDTLKKSESLMHHKEQEEDREYYKRIAEVIKKYDEVILFGPTDAKVELFNHLKTDHHFDKIIIKVIPTDKMTDNQQHAFVREHFSRKY